MFEFVEGLFDPTGFMPLDSFNSWNSGLSWIFFGSELFIFLATISTVIVFFLLMRRRALPFSKLFILFLVVIALNGITQIFEMIVLYYPFYRLLGLFKLLAAISSWVAVLLLISNLQRIFDHLSSTDRKESGTALQLALAPPGRERLPDYIIGILAAVLALLVRAAIDPIVETDHVYVLSLLAVVFVAWQCGFGPSILALILSMMGMIYFFVAPHHSFVVNGLGNQVATGMFFFCGVACAALGETQRQSRWRAKAALDAALAQRAELEVEVRLRQNIENALRESEQYLRSVLENSPDCVEVLTLDGKLLEINKPGLLLKEIDDLDRYRGRDWVESWNSTDQRFASEALSQAQVGKVARFRTGSHSNSGSEKYWDVQTAPIPGLDGRPVRIVSVARDITEQRRAETSVRESEEKFRTIADSIPQLAWMTRPDGYIVWYNQRWFEYTGTTHEQMEGWGWQSVHDPVELPRIINKFQAHLAAGEPWEDTFPLRRWDGAMRWHLSRALPIRNSEGEIVRWFGTNTDITDRLKIENDLRAVESRFRLLTEAIPQIVWNANARGEVNYFNSRWYEYTGTPIDQALGQGWLNSVHPDDFELTRREWSLTTEREGDVFSIEFRLKMPRNDRYRWVLAVAIPLRGDSGTIDQWIGSMTDIEDQKRQTSKLEEMVNERTAALQQINAVLVEEISERKRAEEELKAASTELKRSNLELEQFAYIASHDLQEPLRKIQAFGDRLKTKCRDELPEFGKEYVERMLISAGRMRRLIEDLLSFSRVTSQARAFVKVDLNRLIPEVVSDLDAIIGTTQANVEIGPLPQIKADPSQMRQLFQNLIANALKFQRPQVPPHVIISCKKISESGENNHPDRYTIEVRDNGIGFDEKYLSRIFEMFQRLHGRNEYEGTGVGLAICRKIVERHGGSITARSQEGEGATFIVTLPVDCVDPIRPQGDN